MLTDRLEDIKQVMNDNGTFINFPGIGSQASLISVYGDHRVNIERSIRAIMQLVRWTCLISRNDGKLTVRDAPLHRPANSTSPRSGSFPSPSTSLCRHLRSTLLRSHPSSVTSL